MIHLTHTNRPLPAAIGRDVMAVFMCRTAAPAIGAHGHRSAYFISKAATDYTGKAATPREVDNRRV